MGKSQSSHGDPQGIRHHRSRGLKMCLCDSKHTLCTDTNRDRRTRKKKKDLRKKWKNSEGAVAIEAEIHNGSQAWSREKAAWPPSQKDNLEGSEETFIPGCSIACVPPWGTGGKQSWVKLEWLGKPGKPESSIGLCLVKRTGRTLKNSLQ